MYFYYDAAYTYSIIYFQNVEFKSFVGNIFPAGELFVVATSEGRRHLVLIVT